MGVYPFIAMGAFRVPSVSLGEGLAVNLTAALPGVYDIAHMVIPVNHAL